MGRRETARLVTSHQGQGPTNIGDDARGSALTLYLDTSALLKVYLVEEGTPTVRAGVEASEILASSLITFVETRAAVARRRRENELSPADHRRVLQDFANDWGRYLKIEVTESLVIEAARLADAHRLRAYDAMHLASALLLAEQFAEAPTFGCWDRALRTAAAHEGLPLLR